MLLYYSLLFDCDGRVFPPAFNLANGRMCPDKWRRLLLTVGFDSFPERMSVHLRYLFFFKVSQLTWKPCGNWNIHTVEIFMFPTNFSLQIWAQDVCQEDCPLGRLPVGGLANLLYLFFIEGFLTVSVPVEICIYKSPFFHWKKKSFFLKFLTILNEK